MVRDILLLGTPSLYETSMPVAREELEGLRKDIEDMMDTIAAFRERYGRGRAMAAPQIGLNKRIICVNSSEKIVMVNPELSFPDGEMMEVLDDCMSFPNLLVRVMRRRRCVIRFRDLDWREVTMELEGDMSELLQHEYDHLDGILCTMRAGDPKSFVYRI